MDIVKENDRSFACPVGKLFPAGLFFVTEMLILSKKYRQGV